MIRFTLLFLFTPFLIQSQDFSPLGAKWHYTEYYAFAGDISYLKIESVGDTTIKGKECRILESNRGLFCFYDKTRNFVYSEDSIAWFYVPETDTFQILYDLKSREGSSWTSIWKVGISDKTDTILVTVDSVNTVIINSKPLKRMHVSYQTPDSGSGHSGVYKGEIIERIGDSHYLFHLAPSLSGIACDGNFSGGLRCYEDPELGFYSTGITESCNYTNTWIGKDYHNSFQDYYIYPNPCIDYISIDSQNVFDFIRIYDTTGKVIKELNHNCDRLFLGDIRPGIYVLEIINFNKNVNLIKLIKQ